MIMKKFKMFFVIVGICILLTELGMASAKYRPLTITNIIKLSVVNSQECSSFETKLNHMNDNNWVLPMFMPKFSVDYSFSYNSTIVNNLNANMEIPISPLFVLDKQKNINNLRENVLKVELRQSKMKAMNDALNLYNLLFEEEHLAEVYKMVINKACKLSSNDELSNEIIDNMKISLKQHLITIEEMSYDLKNVLSIPQEENIKLTEDVFSSKYLSILLKKIRHIVNDKCFPQSPSLLIANENEKAVEEENNIRWIYNSVSFFLNCKKSRCF